jgi:hypothetical protein
MASYSISPAGAPWGNGGLSGGMGSLASGSQIAMSTVSTAGSILGGTAPLWTAATWAVPVIGAAVTGVTLALTALFSRKGPKQKTAATQFAEDVIKVLQDNLAAYKAGPRTVSSQAQALANFDAGWTYLTSTDACGNSALGQWGVRCIFERQRAGTCTQAQAEAADKDLSQCGEWDMFADLRDPIANDTGVVADPVLEEAEDLIESVVGEGNSFLLLAGVALAAAFAFGGFGGGGGAGK